MFLRCKYLLLFFILLSCNSANKQNFNDSVIVYSTYCGGCVVKNFALLRHNNKFKDTRLIFDTSNTFILDEAKKNHLVYNHLCNDSILINFGQLANIVYINRKGKKIELKTNESILKYY